MRRRLAWTLLGLAPLFAAPMAVAQARPDAGAEVVEGQVVRVDAVRSKVVVKSSDGRTYEFTASPETLRNLKPGDRIEAKKRATDH